VPDGLEARYQRALFRGTLAALVIILGLLWFVRIAVGRIGPEEFTPVVAVLTWIAALTVFLAFVFARRRRVLAGGAGARRGNEEH
jgi:hypothetical protein